MRRVYGLREVHDTMKGRGINACEEQHIVDQGWFSQIIACGTEWDSVHVRQIGLSACETKMFVIRAWSL